MLQTDMKRFKGPWDCGKHIMQTQGITGLYRGTGLTLLRDCPGSVAYYGGYEYFKWLFQGDSKELSVPATLTAGGLAGICNWLVSVPPDVLKTRLQSSEPGRYPGGGMQIMREMVMKEGIGSLYKGIAPVMLRAFPANAACFLGYETVVKLLDRVM